MSVAVEKWVNLMCQLFNMPMCQLARSEQDKVRMVLNQELTFNK
jgi:hypothetical protein